MNKRGQPGEFNPYANQISWGKDNPENKLISAGHFHSPIWSVVPLETLILT